MSYDRDEMTHAYEKKQNNKHNLSLSTVKNKKQSASAECLFDKMWLKEKVQQQNETCVWCRFGVYTSCLFLVMGKFGYSLRGRRASGGATVKQQIASNCESTEDEGRRKTAGRRPDDFNSPLSGSAFRLVPPPDFTSFCLISADVLDELQTT